MWIEGRLSYSGFTQPRKSFFSCQYFSKIGLSTLAVLRMCSSFCRPGNPTGFNTEIEIFFMLLERSIKEQSEDLNFRSWICLEHPVLFLRPDRPQCTHTRCDAYEKKGDQSRTYWHDSAALSSYRHYHNISSELSSAPGFQNFNAAMGRKSGVTQEIPQIWCWKKWMAAWKVTKLRRSGDGETRWGEVRCVIYQANQNC